METFFLIFVVLAIAASTAVYFLPAIVAGARRARNFAAIFLLNLLFGWTGIGWFGTLIWACVDEPEQTAGRVPCPFCAEPILPAAKVCPHCRRDLPESFTTAQRARNPASLAPLGRRSPIPMLIVLVIFLILVIGAIYHRHLQFERNNPSFISTWLIVVPAGF